MTDIGPWLRAADPLAGEPDLSHVEVAAMRRAVIAAADQDRAGAPWPSALLVATTMAATLVAGVAIGRRFPPAEPEPAPSGGSVVQETGGRQQLQFATRGGTRVIWVFDPEFQP